MNKIRKYLIHLLGGVTREQCDRRVGYTAHSSCICAIKSVLLCMKTCYGMPADEWCKAVYEFTCNIHKQMQKEFEDYEHSIT